MLTEPTVVKVGGNDLEDAAWLARLVGRIADFRGDVVLVHGGGREITRLQRALGAEPEWREGLRVTTPEAMKSVAMVLSGLVNKRLVAALLGAGVDAIGVSGEDGALLRAEAMCGGELGRAGEISAVRAALLRTLLGAGLTPVVSPVSRGPDGGPLNVNADDAAAAIAVALGARELLFVSNVPGVRDGEETIDTLDVDAVEPLIMSGIAAGGMVPKLRAATRVAAASVAVRIGGPEMLGAGDAGTRIVSPFLAGVDG